MKSNKPQVILILMFVLLFLIVLSIVLNLRKGSVENFQGTPTQQAGSQNLFENTHEFVDYAKNSDKLLDMFKSLEEAEKKCEVLEGHQLQREEKQQMRENDRIFKELQEQDKKIHELKEIVKYLTIEKKRRDKINKKCMSSKQRKLNENYNIVKSLNDDGFLNDNSVELDLNVSDSKKMKDFLKSMKKGGGSGKNSEYVDNTANASDSQKCSKRDDYVDIDKIGLNKCYGCDKDKLKDQANYINKDFN
jgi:TolA-binding protein